MKRGDLLSQIKYLLKQIWQVDKGLYGTACIVAFVTVVSRILYVWFPKWIIDSLS